MAKTGISGDAAQCETPSLQNAIAADTVAAMPAAVGGLPPIRVLMYHSVGRYARPRTHASSFCHIDKFRAQMRLLARGPYRVISLDQAYRSLFEAAPLQHGAVVLSFDDGYENFVRWAWPVLQSFGFTASVFPVAGLIGQPATWQGNDFAPEPLMDAATLRGLSAAGVAIGSHGWSHARLTQLASARVAAELRDSKARLEDVLGHAVTDFCYPYGSHDARVIDLTRDAGYRLALTCVRGAANAAPSAFEIPRKAISHGDNALTLLWKLHTRHTPKPHQFKVPAAP